MGEAEEGWIVPQLRLFELSERAKSSSAAGGNVSRLRLAKEFCARNDPRHNAFKTIVQLANAEDVDLGMVMNKMLRSYNGKPFLSNKSHRMRRDAHGIHISQDVNTFGLMARKYYFDTLKYIPKFVIDVALVVEARDDEHLPEQVLGCMRIIRPRVSGRRIDREEACFGATTAEQVYSIPLPKSI